MQSTPAGVVGHRREWRTMDPGAQTRPRVTLRERSGSVAEIGALGQRDHPSQANREAANCSWMLPWMEVSAV